MFGPVLNPQPLLADVPFLYSANQNSPLDLQSSGCRFPAWLRGVRQLLGSGFGLGQFIGRRGMQVTNALVELKKTQLASKV